MNRFPMRRFAALRRVAAWAVFLAACQPAAALPPTATPAPPASATPGSTPVPPTATATPTVPRPTRAPTELPAIPTPAYTPADIFGIWSRSDPQRGDLFLTLLDTGAYQAAHGTPGDMVHAGEYRLDGALFTFVSGWNCLPLEGDVPGQYILTHQAGPYTTFIAFRLYQDACPDRPAALDRFRWGRFTE